MSNRMPAGLPALQAPDGAAAEQPPDSPDSSPLSDDFSQAVEIIQRKARQMTTRYTAWKEAAAEPGDTPCSGHSSSSPGESPTGRALPQKDSMFALKGAAAKASFGSFPSLTTYGESQSPLIGSPPSPAPKGATLDVSRLDAAAAKAVAELVAHLEASQAEKQQPHRTAAQVIHSWAETAVARKPPQPQPPQATQVPPLAAQKFTGPRASGGGIEVLDVSSEGSMDDDWDSKDWEEAKKTHHQPRNHSTATNDNTWGGDSTGEGGGPRLDGQITSSTLFRSIKNAQSEQKGSNLQDLDEGGELLFGVDVFVSTEDDTNSNPSAESSPAGRYVSSTVRMPLDTVSQHVAIFLLSSHSGDILTWNEKMEEWTGVPAAAAIGNQIHAFLPFAEDQEYIQECCDALQRRDQHSKSRVVTFVKADGMNMAHMSLTFSSGKTKGCIIGVGSQRAMCSETMFSKWILDRLAPQVSHIEELVEKCSSRPPRTARTEIASPDMQPSDGQKSDGIISPLGFGLLLPEPHYPGAENSVPSLMLESQEEAQRSALSSLPASSVSLAGAQEVLASLKKWNEFIDKVGRVDPAGWAPLNIHTTFKKLVVDYASEMEEEGKVHINLSFADTVPEEVYTDSVRFPKAVAHLVSDAVRKDGQTQVHVNVNLSKKSDAVGKGFLTVEVINDGEGITKKVQEAVKAGDSRVAPVLCTVAAHLEEMGGQLQFDRRLWSRAKSSSGLSPSKKSIGSFLSRPTDAEPATTAMQNYAVVCIPLITSSMESDRARVVGIIGGSKNTRRKSVADHEMVSPKVATLPELVEAREELQELVVDQVPLIKAVLLENNVAHQMTFCNKLWARSFAVTLVSSEKEVYQQMAHTDIILIDVDDERVDLEKLLSELADDRSEVGVVLASRLLNNQLRTAIEESEWLGLTLPLDPVEVHRVLDEIELCVLRKKIQKQHVEEVRKAFGSGGNLEWQRGRPLGKGTFGEVFEATMKLTGAKMAVKCIPLKTDVDENSLLGEVKLMSEFSHSNIIHYFFSEITEDELLIFMEYAEEGCLQSKIPEGGFKERDVAKYMEDITKGLSYLHSKSVTHRDIKAANVLINNGVCKLTDFGTATRTSGRSKPGDENEPVGTLAYMAPEVTEGVPTGPAADVWSLGCLLLELLTGKSPFSHKGQTWCVVRYVTSLKIGEAVDYGPFPFGVNSRLFLKSTIIIDPTQRMTCDELLKSDLIRNTETMTRKQTLFKNMRQQQSMANLKRPPSGLFMRGASFQHSAASVAASAPASQPNAPVPDKRSRTCPTNSLASEAKAAFEEEKTHRQQQVSPEKRPAMRIGSIRQPPIRPPTHLTSPTTAPLEKRYSAASVSTQPLDDDASSDFSGWGSDNEEKKRQEFASAKTVTDTLRSTFVIHRGK